MDNTLKAVDKAWQEYDKTVRQFYSSQDEVPPILMDKLQDLDRSLWEMRVQITTVHDSLIQITNVLTHQN
jgi:hypothetical protein